MQAGPCPGDVQAFKFLDLRLQFLDLDLQVRDLGFQFQNPGLQVGDGRSSIADVVVNALDGLPDGRLSVLCSGASSHGLDPPLLGLHPQGVEAPDRIGGEPEFSVYEIEAILGLLDHRVVNHSVPDAFQGVAG